MAVLIQYDPRVRVDYTGISNLSEIANYGLLAAQSSTSLTVTLPGVINPDYNPAKATDTYYGAQTLTLYWRLDGSFPVLLDGSPDLANSTITALTMGYLESGTVYTITGFTLPGFQFAYDMFYNNAADLLATIFAGADVAHLQGTGSIFAGGTVDNDVYLPGLAGNYTINVTFGSRSATVLNKAWTVGDQLSNLDHLMFPNTYLRFDSRGIDVAGTGILHTGTATLGAGNTLTVPFVGGSLQLQLNPGYSYLGYSFITMPDGGGGSRVVQSTVDPTYSVMAADGAGGVIGLPFWLGDGTARIAAMQTLLDPVNAGVIGGGVVVATGQPAALPAGQSGEMVVSASGAYVMPAGYRTALVQPGSDVTISGGAANGQLVIGSNTHLAFNAGAGAGSVFAGPWASLVSVYPGAGSQYIDLGSGDDTVVALGGNDTINTGFGNNRILLGAGASSVVSNGWDLIAGGSGNATISAGTVQTNFPTVFLGSGNTLFDGSGTVVGGSGADTLNTVRYGVYWLGSNTDIVNSGGADTIVGAGGAATVTALVGQDLVFAGAGALDFVGGSGASTILGSATGSATLHGGSTGMLVLSYGSLTAFGGTGVDTIAAFGGSMTVHGGGGAALFLGGPGGHNVIDAGAPNVAIAGNATIFGGGDGDVLSAGSYAGDFILAGAGAETINGAGPRPAAAVDRFYGGAGPNLFLAGPATTAIQVGTGAATIQGSTGLGLFAVVDGRAAQVTITDFNPTLDYLSLQGFPAGEAAAALGSAVISGGNETLALSDGTNITFVGFSALTAQHFL